MNTGKMHDSGSYARMLSVGLACYCMVVSGSASAFDRNELPRIETRARTQLPDGLSRHQPRRTASEAESDRARSLAWFGKGRMLFQRQDLEGALRAYQRAYQWNPDAQTALDEIVPLAIHLRRPGVATRYATIAQERRPSDPDLLRQLALQLAQTDQLERAVRLYDRALELLSDKPRKQQWVQTHFERGRVCFLLRQFDRGAESLAVVMKALENPKEYGFDKPRLKELMGDHQVTFTLLGETFLETGQLDRAWKVFEKAREISSNDALHAFHCARIEARRGHRKEALERLEEYFAAKSSDAGRDAYRLLQTLMTTEPKAKPARAENEEDRAFESRCKKLLESNKTDIALIGFLADYYRDAGQLDEALSLFRRLLDLAPSLAAFRGQLSIGHETKQPDVILDAIRQLVDQAGSVEPLASELRTIAADDEMLDQLIAAVYDHQQAKSSGLSDEALGVGFLAIAGRRWHDADRLIKLAAPDDSKKSQQRQLSWGLELFLNDAYERAAKVFRKIQHEYPPSDRAGIAFYLATTLELAGETDDALTEIRGALKGSPDSAILRGRLAWINYHAEHYAEAERLFQDLLDRFDSNYSDESRRELLKEARMSLANLALLRRDSTAAIEWLEQVLDEYPEDAGAMNDLGYLLADENRHLRRALRMVKLAVAAEPDNIAFRDSLGWALYRLGRYEEAVPHLEMAAAEGDPDGIILDHLGDAYNMLHRDGAAVDMWERAIQALSGADEPDRLAALKKKVADHQAEE